MSSDPQQPSKRDREEMEAEMARLISGDVDFDSPEGEEALQDIELTPVELEELHGLRDLAASLDAAAAHREEVEGHAADLGEAPGVSDVAATLSRLAADNPPVRRLDEVDQESNSPSPKAPPITGPRPLPWVRFAAAAGLLLMIPLGIRMLQEPTPVPPGPEQMLGDRGTLRLEPTETGAYGTIHFEPEDQAGVQSYILRVFDGSEALLTGALFEYPLEDSSWHNPEEQAKWPDEVLLDVVGRGPGFETEPLDSLRASR